MQFTLRQMKETGHCTKCNSNRVINYTGNSEEPSLNGATNGWGLRIAQLNRYICADCGFTEEYVVRDNRFLKWSDKILKAHGNIGDGML